MKSHCFVLFCYHFYPCNDIKKFSSQKLSLAQQCVMGMLEKFVSLCVNKHYCFIITKTK